MALRDAAGGRGRGGRPAADDALSLPQKLAGARLRQADDRAGGRAVAGGADRADVEPVARREVVVEERHPLLLVSPAADDEVEPAIGIDVAEAEAFIDRRPAHVGDVP